MRLRNIKGAREAVQESRLVVHDPLFHKGKWNAFFGNDHPLYIEIGMGKGKFISELAVLHPENNYLGIERYSSVLYRALQKEEENPPANLFFICEDASNIEEFFGPGEISRIYLNFSDPWPKEKHAKRRLTSQEFLNRYDNILTRDGEIEFKTDNTDLFDFSLEQIKLAGWNLTACTRDLHHDPVLGKDNIMTEYEEKFSAMGNPICKLIASRK